MMATKDREMINLDGYEIEEKVPLHHFLTVVEGRLADGWKPLCWFLEDGMYTIFFRKL